MQASAHCSLSEWQRRETAHWQTHRLSHGHPTSRRPSRLNPRATGINVDCRDATLVPTFDSAVATTRDGGVRGGRHHGTRVLRGRREAHACRRHRAAADVAGALSVLDSDAAHRARDGLARGHTADTCGGHAGQGVRPRPRPPSVALCVAEWGRPRC